jgi:bifunctional non-homologous end joining protein LigD
VIEVSNPDRVVFPEIQRTKADVVAYYERIAPRLFGYVEDRPLSIKRYPKGLAAAGFFQKNVPAHYPASMGRVEMRRSNEATKRHRDKDARTRGVTVYPIVREPQHLAYLANENAIELHVPGVRASDLERSDRIVLDLDPKPGAVELVRRAAHIVHDALGALGLETTPVATGSKGYHLVAVIRPALDTHALGLALQQFAELVAHAHPEHLTTAFRVANRGDRVFLDWLRNHALATVVAPYSLRARPRANVAAPLEWSEIDAIAPDAFHLDDIDRLLDRPDSLAAHAAAPQDPAPFVSAVAAEFERKGLELVPFDRFRS